MNNPPAFPRPVSKAQANDERTDDYNTHFEQGQSGMTLRDYFAAAALTGMCVVSHPDIDVRRDPDVKQRARACYEVADAMLKARNENVSQMWLGV